MLGANRWLASSFSNCAVARRVVRHLRDDADAEAELDVGLDHVGVERGEHDVGVSPLALNAALICERPVKLKS